MRSGRILLVEDNPDDEALIARALAKTDVPNELQVARDGQEALDRLQGDAHSHDDLPSLVLLDLKLPKIGGLEVLRRIRADERTRLLPIVILTSSRDQKDVLAGYSTGANGYVRKPVEYLELVHAVAAIGMYWLLVNEPPPDRPVRGRQSTYPLQLNEATPP